MSGEDRQSVKKIGIRAAKRYQKYLLTLNKRRGEGEVGWGAVGGGASRAA